MRREWRRAGKERQEHGEIEEISIPENTEVSVTNFA
jgi:hypothetical protein